METSWNEFSPPSTRPNKAPSIISTSWMLSLVRGLFHEGGCDENHERSCAVRTSVLIKFSSLSSSSSSPSSSSSSSSSSLSSSSSSPSYASTFSSDDYLLSATESRAFVSQSVSCSSFASVSLSPAGCNTNAFEPNRDATDQPTDRPTNRPTYRPTDRQSGL